MNDHSQNKSENQYVRDGVQTFNDVVLALEATDVPKAKNERNVVVAKNERTN